MSKMIKISQNNCNKIYFSSPIKKVRNLQKETKRIIIIMKTMINRKALREKIRLLLKKNKVNHSIRINNQNNIKVYFEKKFTINKSLLFFKKKYLSETKTSEKEFKF